MILEESMNAEINSQWPDEPCFLLAHLYLCSLVEAREWYSFYIRDACIAFGVNQGC